MQVSVYLLPDTVEVLEQFGTLSTVADKILTACEKGEIDIFNKPAVNRNYCRRYNVEITNIYYITLLDRFSGKSSKISLSRLINWFAANEMFDTLKWVPEADYNILANTVSNKVRNICAELQQIASKLNDKELAQIIMKLIDWGIKYEAGNKQFYYQV